MAYVKTVRTNLKGDIMKRNNQPLDAFKDHFAKEIFGRSLSDAHNENICVQCGNPALEFEDKLSAKEYQISGLCQDCQDGVFEEN